MLQDKRQIYHRLFVGNTGKGPEVGGGRKERMSREAYLIAPGGYGAKRVHQFLDRLLEERGLKVLESSGLQGSRRWSVVEELASPSGGSPRSAIQVHFEIDQEWMDLEVVGEQEGFREHDIPARMLETLERHTPPNDRAKKWREECREFRRNAAEQRKLMREIRKIHRETRQDVPVVIEYLRANFNTTGGKTDGEHETPTLEYYILDETNSPLANGSPRRFPMKPKRLNVERTWEILEETGLTI